MPFIFMHDGTFIIQKLSVHGGFHKYEIFKRLILHFRRTSFDFVDQSFLIWIYKQTSCDCIGRVNI